MGFFPLPGVRVQDKPKLWASALDYVIENPQQKRLMLIGDSLTVGVGGAGYIYDMQAILTAIAGKAVEIDRYAVSGWRVADIAGHIGDIAAYPNAQVFCILLGTNDCKTDIGYGRGVAKYWYRTLMEGLLALKPDAAVRLGLIPWASQAKIEASAHAGYMPYATWYARALELHEVVKAMARRYGLANPVDFWNLTLGQEDWYIYDGVHMNRHSERRTSAAWVSALSTMPLHTANRHAALKRQYQMSGVPAYGDPTWQLTSGLYSGNFVDMVRFEDGPNGGPGGTMNCDVDFALGEGVLINDVTITHGLYGNKIDAIEIYTSDDGLIWTKHGEVTATTERMSAGEWEGNFIKMYMPPEPFATKNLRIRCIRQWAGPGACYIGQIGFTTLDGYILQ
jgi:lysophospholipase L1-like esterase